MNGAPEERDLREPVNMEPPPAPVPQTETFLTRNVRLITFLVCIALFLAFCGPISVFTISRLVKERSSHRGTVVMTAEECVRLSKQPEKVTFADLRRYVGRYSQTESVENYYVEFGDYLLLATRNKTTDALTVIVENFTTRERVDLFEGDVRAFFAGTERETAA